MSQSRRRAQRGSSSTNSGGNSLDRVDRMILTELQTNARISYCELSEKVNLSESACLRRVKALESIGLIDRYSAVINPAKAGYGTSVFVSIKLERQEHAQLEQFEAAVRQIPEVLACHLMSGEFDYLLHIALIDLADFERIHTRHLTKLPQVVRVQSSFVLRTVLNSFNVPIRG